MASVVNIKITLDNTQAIPSIDQINDSLKKVGVQGTASFQQAGNAAKSMGGHAATGLDSVRLLSQEFGLRLPRAIESMISRVPGITNALSSVLGVMAGIAAAQVFVHVAEEAYKAYEQYVSLNAAADKYYETMKKTREQDFGNPRTIETANERFSSASSMALQKQQEAQALRKKSIYELNPVAAVGDFLHARTVADEGVTAMSQRDQTARTRVDLLHQQALAQIDLNHGVDAQLVGQQKINAELAKKKAIDQESRTFTLNQERANGNMVSPNDGSEEQRMKDSQASAEAYAQEVIRARETALSIMKADDARIQAGLSGEALYHQKMVDDIKEMTQELRNSGQDDALIWARKTEIMEKYFDEMSQRQVKAQNEAAIQAQKTAALGLTGIERINADRDIRLNEINSNPALADNPEQAAAERVAAATEATQKIQVIDDTYAEHSKALQESMTAAALQGYAKIEAERLKQRSEEDKAYDKTSKSPTDLSLHNTNLGSIDSDAQAKRTQLAERNQQEDLRYDQQAADAEKRVRENGIMGWVASYRNGIADIQSQEAARLVKLQDDVAKEGLTQQEAERRRTDIVREADASIAEQNQQMQQKIAGDLQSAFTNPVEFIKSQMEKMFFEIVAGWIMRMNVFKTLFGQTMGGLQPGGAAGSGSGAGGLLSNVMRGTGGFANGHPSVASIYGPAGSAGATGGTASGASGTASAVAAQAQSSGSGGSGIGTAIGDVSSAASTISGVGSAITSINSSDPGSYSDAQAQAALNGGSSLSTIGQDLGAAGLVGTAGYSAEQTTVKAFDTGTLSGTFSGMLGDAGSGAAIGSLFGPEGTLIGAGVGAAVGLASGLTGMAMGEGGNLAARAYYQQSVLPTLEGDMNNPSTDFQTAASNVGNTSSQALAYMSNKYGKAAAAWVNDNYMKKEVAAVLARIEDIAKGGRQYTTLSAAEFHTGGTISGFGSLGTSSDEGFIHAMLNETVMNTAASSVHGPVLSAMNTGASASDIASMYLADAKPSGSSMAAPAGDTHHWNVNALDPKSFDFFLKNGGARQITKHQNTYASQYAGDGISG